MLKIAVISPVFKTGDTADISNYRPISVLPCFHSAEHAITQLVDQIYESFENDNFTVGIFVDLSKAFDAIDHTILLKKLKMYGITDMVLRIWYNLVEK